MTTKLKCYSALLLTTSVSLIGCQTTEIVAPKTKPIYENALPSKTDADSDGVLDAIDECPKTPPHIVVDVKGCSVEVDVGGLEIAFNGFFAPMSSQLPAIYEAEITKIVDNLDDYPKANVFIFGHTATNEINKDAVATFGFDSLSRNRALNIKNTLVSQQDIDAERIGTYECSNKLLFKNTDYINPSFKALELEAFESKQRRATLMASSSVNDLTNLKYEYYIRRYGEYAKHCVKFE